MKSDVGNRRFVSGPKQCVELDIRLSILRSRKARRDWNKTEAPLLPGLPDDLAIACLICVPRFDHRKLRLVCKRWNLLLSGNYLYSLRREQGMSEEWVYVMKRNSCGKISWFAFDPIHQFWQALPPVPQEYSEAYGFRCAVLSGCYLFLFGGKHPKNGPMRCVVFYDACADKWYRAPDMIWKRQYFGSCVINNRLYVAGGAYVSSEGILTTLRSAEVYDPNKNRWTAINEMSTGMTPFFQVVYEEKWVLKGLDSNLEFVSEVYTPETNSWFTDNNGIITGYRNPCISFNGRLYTSDCRDAYNLRVYDGSTGTWNRLMDSEFRLSNSWPSEAAALVSLNGNLCIVCNNMSIILVDVSNPGRTLETNSARVWKIFSRKSGLKAFVTNLWSSIVGRRYRIDHCQVLQA